MSPTSSRTSNLVTVAALGVVAVVLLAATHPWDRPVTQDQAQPGAISLPSEPLLLDETRARGAENAKVAMIQFSEFQCPFCGVFARTVLPELERQYVDTGRVRVAFMHYPLRSIHPLAMRAAIGAECASAQGKFWDLHDAMFGHQADLSEQAILSLASGLAMDGKAFRECLSRPSEKVHEDIALGDTLGVRGTPTFYFGKISAGRVVVSAGFSGARDVAGFAEILNGLLEGVGSGTSDGQSGPTN